MNTASTEIKEMTVLKFGSVAITNQSPGNFDEPAVNTYSNQTSPAQSAPPRLGSTNEFGMLLMLFHYIVYINFDINIKLIKSYFVYRCGGI